MNYHNNLVLIMVLKNRTEPAGPTGSTGNQAQSGPIKMSKTNQNRLKLGTEGKNGFTFGPVFKTNTFRA